MTVDTTPASEAETLDQVVIRFAGDSGDGMQLVGDRFTELSAAFGNDLATLPNYPAEIRAPAGTIAGVSSFQVHISDHDIVTPGDVAERARGDEPRRAEGEPARPVAGHDGASSTPTASRRATSRRPATRRNPLEDGSLAAYNVYQVPMTSITVEATKELGVKPRDAERSKNFFALGLLCWMYTRPTKPMHRVDREAVRRQGAGARRQPRRVPAPVATSVRPPSCSTTPTRSRPRRCRPGKYRNIIGNLATVVRARSPRSQQRQAAARLRVSTRSRRRPTSSTSCRSTRTSA